MPGDHTQTASSRFAIIYSENGKFNKDKGESESAEYVPGSSSQGVFVLTFFSLEKGFQFAGNDEHSFCRLNPMEIAQL